MCRITNSFRNAANYQKAAIYTVADAREGFKAPEKTIIGRIVSEFKKL